MNREHDLVHLDMADWPGVPSYAIQQAAGRALTEREAELASIEEEAALAVERLIRAQGRGLPRDRWRASL